jgi:hypothetical protein
MNARELVFKHPYIISCWNDVQGHIHITIILDIKGTYTNELYDFSFNNIEECDTYLVENYSKLRYEMMEEIYQELHTKIANQTRELRELHKKLNKSREE